jgi:hypothetical protein
MGAPEQERPVSAEPTELAWAAGFFDGEGTTFVNRHKIKHRNRPGQPVYYINSPAVAVCQVERQPLDRFARIVGGRVPTGPYKPKTKNSRPYYRWDAMGRPSVVRVLTLLWPYMSEPKRAQAHVVWEELRAAIGPKSPRLPPLPA